MTLAKSSVSGFTPKFTEIQFSNPNQTVHKYDHNNNIVSSVEISCTVAVEGSFSITWTGPNGTITDSGDKIKIYSADTTRTSILRINQLNLMDNGTYSCEASYSHTMNFDVGSAINTITLILGGIYELSKCLMFLIEVVCSRITFFQLMGLKINMSLLLSQVQCLILTLSRLK